MGYEATGNKNSGGVCYLRTVISGTIKLTWRLI